MEGRFKPEVIEFKLEARSLQSVLADKSAAKPVELIPFGQVSAEIFKELGFEGDDADPPGSYAVFDKVPEETLSLGCGN